MKNQYQIKISWSDEDQVFIARVPELEGVVTHGRNQQEALAMALEAIDLHLDSLKAHNEEIPEPISKQNLSGKFPLRLGVERQGDLYLLQRKLGFRSANELICLLIDEKLREEDQVKRSNFDSVGEKLRKRHSDRVKSKQKSEKEKYTNVSVGMLSKKRSSQNRLIKSTKKR